MVKKIGNVLLATAACAALAAGGISITALAEGMASACPHEFCTVENVAMSFEEDNDNMHIVHCYEEIYCWDCGGYFTQVKYYWESHNYNGTDICVDCGHKK